jgi:hypothetical protein
MSLGKLGSAFCECILWLVLHFGPVEVEDEGILSDHAQLWWFKGKAHTYTMQRYEDIFTFGTKQPFTFVWLCTKPSLHPRWLVRN